MLKKIKIFSFIYSQLKKLFFFEFVLDLIFSLKTFLLFKKDAFFAYKRFNYKKTKNVGIVFFCGIGDVIYGLPALKQFSKLVKKSGFKVHAYVEEQSSVIANPAVFSLLESTELFDSINYFHGHDTGYWKYFDWTTLRKGNGKTLEIYPFLFRTSRTIKNRVLELEQQFGVHSYNEWPTIKPKISPEYLKLKTLLAAKKFVVFLQLDSRSGQYVYPHLDELFQLIKSSDVLTPDITFVFFSTVQYPSSQKIISVDPKTIPFGDQIALIKEFATCIFAINSYLWAIGLMLNTRLLGIHYYDFDDGHQLWYKGAHFLTPSRYVYERIGEGTLAIEGIDFCRLKENPRMVEYSPASLYKMLITEKKLCTDASTFPVNKP